MALRLRRAAAAQPVRHALSKDVEDRREDQAEDGDTQHPREDRGAKRLPQLRPRTRGDDQRHHPQDEGERGHQDRPQPQPRRLDRGLGPRLALGMGLARAHRVTYVGELGWELYVPSDQAAHVFECLEQAGAASGLRLCGLHALDSCRIEKAYRHFGHDITDEDHVLEAGLGFAVRTGKGDFIGRDAVLRMKEAGLERRLLQFRLRDPEPLIFHNEAVVRDGSIASIVTSGNYGHHLGGAIGLGYVPCRGESEDELLASSYEIEVAGKRHAADVSLRPMYDPTSERTRL